MNVHDFTRRLPESLKARKTGADTYESRCPAHDDANPSLSISAARHGGVVVNCHAGCSTQDVVEAAGLAMTDLFIDDKPKSDRQERATLEKLSAKTGISVDSLRSFGAREVNGRFGPEVEIPYRDVAGDLIRTKTRHYMDKGEHPKFRWNKDGQPGQHVYGLERLERYNGKALIITEGESDAWALWDVEAPAVGIPGATNANLLSKDIFAGYDVIYVCEDQDDAGREFAESVRVVVRALSGKDALIIRPPHGHNDIGDWRKAAGLEFKSQLVEVMTQLMRSDDRPLDPALHCFSEIIEVTPQQFVWEPYIPRGYVTVIGSRGGMGKSTALAKIAAHVTRGEDILGTKVNKGRVLFINCEDALGEQTQPRIHASGCDPAMTFSTKEAPSREFALSDDGIELLKRYQASCNPDMIVIDTWTRAAKIDQNKAEQVQRALDPLLDIALSTKVAIVLVAHHKKGKADGDAGDMLRGSGNLRDQVRSQLNIFSDPEAGGDRLARVLTHDKCNVAQEGPVLRWRLVSGTWQGHRPGVTEWVGQSAFASDDIASMNSEQLEQIVLAQQILNIEMGNSTAIKFVPLLAKARASGIPPSLLKTAIRNLGLVTIARADYGTEGATAYIEDPKASNNVPI